MLLLERAQEPNRGFWSPCGGKLKMDIGESPYACACREAREEIGLEIAPPDLHLAGIVSEHGYQGQTHWLMFLFEVKVRLKSLPPPHAEGRFEFFPREEIAALENSADRPRTNLAVVLAVSRRIFRRALPLPSGRAERVDAGRACTIQMHDEEFCRAHGLNLQSEFSCDEPIIDLHSDDYFMGEALRQAARAYEAEEVPVGAVIVREGRIIARAFNQVELLKDATAHAEMLALTQAEEAVGDWRLTDCTLYVTKEPCPMCAGAIVHTRLARVVFGASDPKGGAAGGAMNLLQFPTLNHRCEITAGVREAECRALLQTFFARAAAPEKMEKEPPAKSCGRQIPVADL